jgi:4-hydroxy-2-oxoheptanedioate aldolase
MTRLNKVIAALERGQKAFGTFAPAGMESAQWVTLAPYDGVIYEMEHRPWDAAQIRDTLQHMLSSKQILASGTTAPAVTPFIRIPANGIEMNQWMAKQALDMGALGVVWPHISNADQAYNAVSACRYPRRQDAPLYEPAGMRGDSPTTASRFWGVDTQTYYKRADVWPLARDGEVLVILMIEDLQAIANLDDILSRVPGIGAVLIGEGDLSQELGYPRQYEHPEVVAAMREIVRSCKARKVAVGHPHVSNKNVERVLSEGFDILLTSPSRSFSALEAGRSLANRT